MQCDGGMVFVLSAKNHILPQKHHLKYLLFVVRRVLPILLRSCAAACNAMQGGNSGGPVIDENTDTVVAIHTNGGCSSSGGSNVGKKIYPETLSRINYLKSLPEPTFGPSSARPSRMPVSPTTRVPTMLPTTLRPAIANNQTDDDEAATPKLPSATPTTTRIPTPLPTTLRLTTRIPTRLPTTRRPTTAAPTTSKPSSPGPTTGRPSTRRPTGRPTSSSKPSSPRPTTGMPSTRRPTRRPTSSKPSSPRPTTATPTTRRPTPRPTTRRPTRPTITLPTPICGQRPTGAAWSSTYRDCIMRNGVMFDVVAKGASISITSMEIDVSNGTAAQVWTKAGGHFGFETNASSWTKIAGKVRDRSYPWASPARRRTLILLLI